MTTYIALFKLTDAGIKAAKHIPLPTLRQHPRGRLRTAWGRCGSLLLHRSGLTWAFSGQVVRFIGTSKNSGCCFGIQGLSPIS